MTLKQFNKSDLILKELRDADLILKTKALVGEEQKITQLILEYLAEIDRRRLFAARGFSSLFEFCVKELGYPGGSAQRRIDSMRLIKSLPEAKEKLASGEVNLSTLSQLQVFIRNKEAYQNFKLNHDEKLGLLKTIENKSQRECEREFVKILPAIIKTKESIKPKTPDFAEIKFIASKELESKLQELKNLFSHQNKSNSMAELIEIMADLALRDKAKVRASKSKSKGESESEKMDSLSTEPHGEVTKAQETGSQPVKNQLNQKHISSKSISAAEMKRMVWRRDFGKCQYTDPLTKRKCFSKFKIQIDHIHPKALGGGDSLENLRLLCATHNQFRAIQVFSPKHMIRFVPDLK